MEFTKSKLFHALNNHALFASIVVAKPEEREAFVDNRLEQLLDSIPNEWGFAPYVKKCGKYLRAGNFSKLVQALDDFAREVRNSIVGDYLQ